MPKVFFIVKFVHAFMFRFIHILENFIGSIGIYFINL